MIIRVTTNCNFVGCETVHYVEVPDGMSSDDLDVLTDEMLAEDIAPWVDWQVLTEEEVAEAIEDGYEIE